MVIMTNRRRATMLRVGVAEAKARLSELLGRVAHGGERVILQRRGRPVAALVPMQDLERATGAAQGDWLDSIVGLCADTPELCDMLDQIVKERQTEMPRETSFAWDDER
jgi:prevent-host-death family protein